MNKNRKIGTSFGHAEQWSLFWLTRRLDRKLNTSLITHHQQPTIGRMIEHDGRDRI